MPSNKEIIETFEKADALIKKHNAGSIKKDALARMDDALGLSNRPTIHRFESATVTILPDITESDPIIYTFDARQIVIEGDQFIAFALLVSEGSDECMDKVDPYEQSRVEITHFNNSLDPNFDRKVIALGYFKDKVAFFKDDKLYIGYSFFVTFI